MASPVRGLQSLGRMIMEFPKAMDGMQALKTSQIGKLKGMMWKMVPRGSS